MKKISPKIKNIFLGARILFARKKLGLTQEQLGLKCGWKKPMAQTRIYNYERGLRTPRGEDIAILAKALNLTASALFFGEKPTK